MWRRLCRIGEDGGVARLPDAFGIGEACFVFQP